MTFATIEDYKYIYPETTKSDAQITEQLEYASTFLSKITYKDIVLLDRSSILNRITVKIAFYELNPEKKRDGSIISETVEGYSYKLATPEESLYGVTEVDNLIEMYFRTVHSRWNINGGTV